MKTSPKFNILVDINLNKYFYTSSSRLIHLCIYSLHVCVWCDISVVIFFHYRCNISVLLKSSIFIRNLYLYAGISDSIDTLSIFIITRALHIFSSKCFSIFHLLLYGIKSYLGNVSNCKDHCRIYLVNPVLHVNYFKRTVYENNFLFSKKMRF